MSLELKRLKEAIERLRTYRDSDDEMLPPDELLKGFLKISADAAPCHSAYHHYTTIAAFEKIFENKNESSLRLSRLASATLNDHNESDKYIKYELAKQTFIACFNHEGAECANLWWLYARGNPEAIRITFPAQQFSDWCRDLSSQGVVVADVLYAAVKGEKDDYAFDRQNALCWEDLCARVKDLRKLLAEKDIAGRIKDYEWRAERETRIIVHKKTSDRFVYVTLPDALIENMRITTSPWVTDDLYEQIKNRVCQCLKGRWKCTERNFRPSVLEKTMDALSRWKTCPNSL